MTFFLGAHLNMTAMHALKHHTASLQLALDILRKCIAAVTLIGVRRGIIADQATDYILGSLPLLLSVTGLTGLIMTNQMGWHLNEAMSNVSVIPGFTAQFVLRELGVTIPALLLVARVGASMTAETASMKITEQLDAMKLLKIDLVRYHIFPRWIAFLVSCVVLTLLACLIAMAFAILSAVVLYGFNVDEYLNSMRPFIKPIDITCIVTKALIFGVIIPPISFAYGIRTGGGAQGVGQATTDSVVAGYLAVAVLDFILTAVFSSLF
jgi:phospholipid/cholesterol/gamma-HCH transport system permease protein